MEESFLDKLLKLIPNPTKDQGLNPTAPSGMQQDLTQVLGSNPMSVTPQSEVPPMGMAESLLSRSQGPAPVAPLVPPLGMAESLRQRSGDDMIKPSSSIASAGKSDLFRKESAIEPIRAEQPTEVEKDSELEDAMAARNKWLGLMMMGKGSEQIGTALAGTQSNKNYLDELKTFADQQVGDVKEKRKAADEKLARDIRKFEFASAKDKDDPNSPSSKFYRDTMKELTGQAGINLNIPENMSAAELEKLYPTLINVVNAKEARLARLEQAKLLASSKKDREDQKADDKKVELTNKLRTEADKQTKTAQDIYDQRTQAVQELTDFIENPSASKGFRDIAITYGFIKGRDDSAVREGEIKLLGEAGSFPDRARRAMNRALKGETYNREDMRALIDLLQRENKSLLNTYNKRVERIASQAKEQGLDPSKIIRQDMYQASQQAGEVERKTKDGRTAIFDAKTKQFIRYKD